jgi:hypothetical protein
MGGIPRFVLAALVALVTAGFVPAAAGEPPRDRPTKAELLDAGAPTPDQVVPVDTVADQLEPILGPIS